MASSRATILHHGGSMRPMAMLAGLVLFLLVAVLPAYGLFTVFTDGPMQTSEMFVVGGSLAGLIAAVWIGVFVAKRFDRPEPGPVELDRLPEVLVLSLTPSSTSRARLVGSTWRLEVPAGGLLELDADSRPQSIYPMRFHRWHSGGEVLEFSMPLDSTTLSLEPLVEACERLDIRLTVAGDWVTGLDDDADDAPPPASEADADGADVARQAESPNEPEGSLWPGGR